MEKPKLTKKNYELEEDYVIAYECMDCDFYDPDLLEEPVECERCGSEDIINTTSHEDTTCDKCGKFIDMWEDVYVADTYTTEPIICKYCYQNLPEK